MRPVPRGAVGYGAVVLVKNGTAEGLGVDDVDFVFALEPEAADDGLRNGFAAELSALKIPYAFVDNKIDELDYMLYYGVDPVKSGSLGAFLLTDRTHPSEIALVRLHPDPERIVVGFDDLKDNLRAWSRTSSRG